MESYIKRHVEEVKLHKAVGEVPQFKENLTGAAVQDGNFTSAIPSREKAYSAPDGYGVKYDIVNPSCGTAFSRPDILLSRSSPWPIVSCTADERRCSLGNSQAMNFGKSRARLRDGKRASCSRRSGVDEAWKS